MAVFSGGGSVAGVQWRGFSGGGSVAGVQWRGFSGGGSVAGVQWRGFSGGGSTAGVQRPGFSGGNECMYFSTTTKIRILIPTKYTKLTCRELVFIFPMHHANLVSDYENMYIMCV